MELKKRRFSSPYLDLTRGSKQDCVAGQVYPGQRGREEQLSKREGEMEEQTYLDIYLCDFSRRMIHVVLDRLT